MVRMFRSGLIVVCLWGQAFLIVVVEGESSRLKAQG